MLSKNQVYIKVKYQVFLSPVSIQPMSSYSPLVVVPLRLAVDPAKIQNKLINIYCYLSVFEDHHRMIGKNDSDHISYHFYTVSPIALSVTGRCRCTKCAFCAIRNGGL